MRKTFAKLFGRHSIYFFFIYLFLSDVDGGWKIYRLLKNNKNPNKKNEKLKSFVYFYDKITILS